jgi:hypothetical protein
MARPQAKLHNIARRRGTSVRCMWSRTWHLVTSMAPVATGQRESPPLLCRWNSDIVINHPTHNGQHTYQQFNYDRNGFWAYSVWFSEQTTINFVKSTNRFLFAVLCPQNEGTAIKRIVSSVMLSCVAFVRTAFQRNLAPPSSGWQETSVLTRATRRNIPENTILHSHRRENFKILQLKNLFKLILLSKQRRNISEMATFWGSVQRPQF